MSNGNQTVKTRYAVAKREVAATYQSLRRNEIDGNKLTMYDLGDEGPAQSANPSQQYPDWTEDQVFTVTGPMGETSTRKGKRFTTLMDAVAYYSKLQGANPVVTVNGKAATPSNNPEIQAKEMLGRFYGMKFRLPKSEAMVQALREARNAE